MSKSHKENELRLLRVLDAPVKLVWEMWTQNEHVNKWWGPRGFTLTTSSKKVQPGGQWIYTMHGPDGVDYPNITTYHEVVDCSRLVYDHGASVDRKALFQVTATFEEREGKTILDMTMAFETAQAAQEIKKFIKQANGDSTWDRLAEYIEETQRQKDVFIINRSFAASQESLFEMWTNPKHFAQWMGPTGSTMETIQAIIEEGGCLHYVMNHSADVTLYGMVKYQTIQAPHLLVYTQNFCDKEGTLIKPSFAPTWPNQMRTTLLFSQEDAHETRLTLQWEIEGDASEIERQTFHEAKTGMMGGWTGSFDKLEEALNQREKN